MYNNKEHDDCILFYYKYLYKEIEPLCQIKAQFITNSKASITFYLII